MATVEKKPLSRVIEMHETYVGGKYRGNDGRRHRHDNKEIVVGIKQRGGELRFFHAEDVKSGTLAKYIKETVSADIEVIVTDALTSYPSAVKQRGIPGLEHKTVNHFDGVYVDGDITTNGIEPAFSLLKRASWDRGIASAKHLPAYLEEMTLRFNRRHSKTLFLEVTADPLTFQELTAH